MKVSSWIIFVCLSIIRLAFGSIQSTNIIPGCVNVLYRQPQSSFECLSCDSSYKQASASTCEYLNPNCASGSSIPCSLNYCTSLNSADAKLCASCSPPYTLYQGVCKFYCDSTSKFTTLLSDCACQVNGCSECETNQPTVCKTCKTETPKKVGGKCFDVCPKGTFTATDGTCTNCPNWCTSCTSATECTACDYGELPTCGKCTDNKYYYEGYCQATCPYGTALNAIYPDCERTCNQSFPLYNSDGTLKKCEVVTSDTAEFCYASVFKLKENLRLNVTAVNDYFILKATFLMTPQACFRAELFSGDYNITSIQTPVTDSSFNIQKFKIQSSELGLLECTLVDCVFRLKVYWGPSLQYVFKIVTSTKLSSNTVINAVSLGEKASDEIEVVCSDCVIPTAQIAASSLTLTCGATQTCTDNSIIAPFGSTISFKQTVTSAPLVNSVLTPHSLRIDLYASKDSQIISTTLYIKDYTYSNVNKGSITYSFKAISTAKGVLTVTSVIKDASTRMLSISESAAVSSSKTVYPQMVLTLSVPDVEGENQNLTGQSVNQEEGSSSTIYIIIAVGCVVILLLVIGIYILSKKNAKLQEVAKQVSLKKEDTLKETSNVQKQEEIPDLIIVNPSCFDSSSEERSEEIEYV